MCDSSGCIVSVLVRGSVDSTMHLKKKRMSLDFLCDQYGSYLMFIFKHHSLVIW